MSESNNKSSNIDPKFLISLGVGLAVQAAGIIWWASSLQSSVQHNDFQIQMMAKDAKENNTRITDMFGSIEAGQAALILSTDNAKGFNEQLGEMAKKSGATEEAFNTVDQGFSRMMEKLMVGLEAIKFAIGKALGPVVDSLMPTLLKGLKMIGNLPWNSVGEVLGEIMKSFEPLMEVLFELVKELFRFCLLSSKWRLGQLWH